MPRIEDEDDLLDDQDGGEGGIDWRSRVLTWGLAGAALLLGFLIPYMLYLNHQAIDPDFTESRSISALLLAQKWLAEQEN